MFDNPFFTYAGVSNPNGKDATIISLTNTTSEEKMVSLFNAQENLVKENQGLPDGVVANVTAIYEMPTAQDFSCYINLPLSGFEEDTEFFLVTTRQGEVRYFQLETDVILGTEKTLAAGYNQVFNPTLYRLPNETPIPRLSATAEGTGGNLRFIFGIPFSEDLAGNNVIQELRVQNSNNGCLDRFDLALTRAASAGSGDRATYSEVLQSTNFAPFGLDSIVLQSPKIQELAKNPIFVTERDANGNRNEQQVFLQRTPYTRPDQRIMRNIKEVDGATEVRMTLPKNTFADLYLYEKNRIIG